MDNLANPNNYFNQLYSSGMHDVWDETTVKALAQKYQLTIADEPGLAVARQLRQEEYN